jgi:hypothetical protein
VLAVVTVLTVLAYLATSRDGLDHFGKPIGTDFISFWAASHLALAGHPAEVYAPVLHEATERALFPTAPPGYFAFFYPPTFLLLCLPLAALPYFLALTAWLLVGFIAFFACLRRLLPQRWAILPSLIFPGALTNIGHGQNGFITAACLGWGMVLSERRPFLAGACLGLLVMKPQLILAAPVALLVARRWTIIAGAMTSGFGLAIVSWLILGDEAWRGFLHVAPIARATLEQGLVESWKMASVFAATRLLHGGLVLAYVLQGMSAVTVCVLLGRIAIRRPGGQIEGLLLITGTLLCTPFLLDYDLTCLALPIAWVAAEAQRTQWCAWEKIVLLVAYILPMVARPLAMSTGVSIAPLVLFALFLVISRRAAKRT